MFYNRGHSSSCLSTQYEHVGGEVSNNFDVSAKKAELAKAITAVIKLRDTKEYKTKADADAKSVADSKMPAAKADTAATKKRETGNSDRPSSGASKYRPIKYGYKNLSLSDEDSDKPSNVPSFRAEAIDQFSDNEEFAEDDCDGDSINSHDAPKSRALSIRGTKKSTVNYAEEASSDEDSSDEDDDH